MRSAEGVLHVCNGNTVSTYGESPYSCTLQNASVFGVASVAHGPEIGSAKLTKKIQEFSVLIFSNSWSPWK